MRPIAFALALIASSVTPGSHGVARAAPPVTLKVATLAPAGTPWADLYQRWASSVERRTTGQVKIEMLLGGVAGDERHQVRKMRLGQLSGAAFSAVGLGLVQSVVSVLVAALLIQ